MTPFRTGPLPRTIAHRGGSGIRPENTLESFRHAHSFGVRTMELDVHLTTDGVLVVHHDETVDRTTNGTGPISICTLADLRSLDAGYRFEDELGELSFRGMGLRIPTLEEVVTELADCSFVIELKPTGPAIALAIRRFVDRMNVHDRVCVAGFHEPTLAAFRSLGGPRVRSSGGQDAIQRFWLASRIGADRLLTPAFDMLQVPPVHHGLRVIDRRFVAAAHRRGIEVHAWTIDDPLEMKQLLDLGVDAIITDRPDRMMVLGRQG